MIDSMNKPKKIIHFKRDNGIVTCFASNAIVPAIKKGVLVGSDQISSNGESWFRLDKHPQLSYLFTTQLQEKTNSSQPNSSIAIQDQYESRAINKNNYQAGLEAVKKGKLKEAYEEWLPLGKQGDMLIQFKLGVMYDQGKGVAQDHEEAFKWYYLSAEQGLANAQYNLGSMYAKGEGVAKDEILSYLWWNIAGSSGHKKAEINKALLKKKMSPTQIEQAREMAIFLQNRG
jgi:TPR repeat protein